MSATVVDYVELLQNVRAEIGTLLPRLTCLARRMCHEDEQPELLVNHAVALVANGEREMDTAVYADLVSFLCGVVGGAAAQRRSIVDSAHKAEHEATAQSELDQALAEAFALSDEEIAKENEEAGYAAATHLAQTLVVLDSAIAEYQVPEVIEVAPPPVEKRPRSSAMWLGLAGGALAMVVMGVAAAKLAASPDSPVGSTFCVDVKWANGASAAPASLEGVLRLVNEDGQDFYVLAMQDPVCRTTGAGVSVLEARAAPGVALQPLVGQKVRVEADLSERALGTHRAVLATIRSASAAP